MSSDAFVDHRNLLFTIAYEMLGSAADAEDVVQDTWLRWAGVDQAEIREPRAYLVRIVTRKALDQLRARARRREDYIGPWLPEPLLTAPDVADDAELADSLSTAMLLVLETLTPTERAVFVLREVFALDYGELAKAVRKSPAAVRQIAHRAREHVAARRPRGPVSAVETRSALESFRRAIVTGDLQDFADVLAPDVVMLGDGGGVKQALPRPVVGADKVIRLLAAGLASPFGRQITAEPAEVNGWPALLLRLDGELDSVLTLQLAEGRVTGIYTVRNPEKLSGVVRETPVGRR